MAFAELGGQIAEELVELDGEQRGGAALVLGGVIAEPEVRVHGHLTGALREGVQDDVRIPGEEFAGRHVLLLHRLHGLDAPYLHPRGLARAGEKLRGGHG